jgi:putative transposase
LGPCRRGPVGQRAAATAARQTPLEEPGPQAGNHGGPAPQIANQRKDFHHKQARDLVARYDLLVVEDLQIANMLRRAKPVADPDNPGQYVANGARAKSGLSRSISDAGWGRFISILRAKAEEAGRAWIEVDPRHTSDRCEKCGHAAPENRVTQAEFRCAACGHGPIQADEHAARNLLGAGLALHAQAA